MSNQHQAESRSAEIQEQKLSDLSAPKREQFRADILPLADDQSVQPVAMPVLTPDPRLTPRTPVQPSSGNERPVRMPVKDL